MINYKLFLTLVILPEPLAYLKTDMLSVLVRARLPYNGARRDN